MGIVIGIDLGTSNSRISVFDGKKAIILSNDQGQKEIASCVTFLENRIRIVGLSPAQQKLFNPQNTIYGIKPFIDEDDLLTMKDDDNLPYTIVYKDENPYIIINGQKYTPLEIGASILYETKRFAEDVLCTKINDAVITVPTYFNNAQRKAIKIAGQIAGINIRRIISDSTAAAMAYGANNNIKDMRIAVFDLGESSLSISIVDMGEGVFEVISSNGNNQLGGSNFNQIITDWLVQEFKTEEGINLKKDPEAMYRIKDAAEKAKIELSSVTSTVIYIPNITYLGGVPIHIEKTLTRVKFEQLANNLLQACLIPCQNAIRDSGFRISDIDKVILTGNSSRIPSVQAVIKNYFGKESSIEVNYENLAALGAAIQGAIINNEYDNIVLLDATSQTLGLETLGGVMTNLVWANTSIPCKTSETFSTIADNQTEVTIHVLQGENLMANQNKSLGWFSLRGITPARRGEPQIEITFDIDANNIVKVCAQDKTSSRKEVFTLDTSKDFSSVEIEKMRTDVAIKTITNKKKKIDILNKAEKEYTSQKRFMEINQSHVRPYEVFISYRREGGDKYARTIQQALEKQYKVFLDYDELKDGVFDQRIMFAIKQSPVFLLLLTKGSLDRCVNERDWVREEILYAAKCKCHIVPVNIDDTFDGIPEKLPRELKEIIGAHQFSELQMKTLFKASIQQLIKDRIAPYIYKEEKKIGAEIHLETDADCNVLLFKNIIGLIHANKDEIIYLKRGKHKLEFASVEYDDIVEQKTLEINDYEYIYSEEVKLKYRIQERKGIEEEKRIKTKERLENRKKELLKFVPVFFIKDENLITSKFKKLHSSLNWKDSKYGFVNYKGEYVIESKWKEAKEFSDGLAAVQDENGNWGFIDANGQLAIPCQWKQTGSFSNELCYVVSCDDRFGFINKNGVIVIPCIWSNAFPASEGLIVVSNEDKKYGVIDKQGIIIIPCQWDCLTSFSEGLCRVKNKGKWGFLNKRGDIAIPCIWNRAFDFSEGYAAVEDPTGKWGYINHSGSIIFPCIWQWACPFSENRACVENEEGRMGFIDTDGNLAIPYEYYNVYILNEDNNKYGFSFKNGVAYVENESFHGFIDFNGIIINMDNTDSWMKRPEDFEDDVAWVLAEIEISKDTINNGIILDNQWRLIDKNGRFLK